MEVNGFVELRNILQKGVLIDAADFVDVVKSTFSKSSIDQSWLRGKKLKEVLIMMSTVGFLEVDMIASKVRIKEQWYGDSI